MKRIILYIVIFASVGLIACTKKCDCKLNWDPSVTYVKGDLVNYNGKCWEASDQGRGIIPGPWLQNGNDIWQECSQ